MFQIELILKCFKGVCLTRTIFTCLSFQALGSFLEKLSFWSFPTLALNVGVHSHEVSGPSTDCWCGTRMGLGPVPQLPPNWGEKVRTQDLCPPPAAVMSYLSKVLLLRGFQKFRMHCLFYAFLSFNSAISLSLLSPPHGKWFLNFDLFSPLFSLSRSY